MNEPSELADKRKRTMRGFSLYIALLMVLPILLCGGIATWFLGRQASAEAKLEKRVGVYREQGLPVDYDTLQAFYEAGSEEFDSQSWVVLGERLQSEDYAADRIGLPCVDSFEKRIPGPGEPWLGRQPVVDFLELRALDLQELFRLARAEAKREGKPLRFPVRFDSYSPLLLDADRSRLMARLLWLQHSVAVYDGDDELALDCLHAIRVVQRNCVMQPLTNSNLTVLGNSQIANKMLRLSIENDRFPRQQLVELAAELPVFEDLFKRFQRVVAGERASILPVFTSPELADEFAPQVLPVGRAIDALYFLDYVDSVEKVQGDDPAEFRQQVENLTLDILNNESVGGLQERDHELTYLLLPSFSECANAAVAQVESNRLARLAIALRMHQRDTGSWPKTLEQLPPPRIDLPEFRSVSRRPFGYKITAEGEAILWSVDPRSGIAIPEQPPNEGDGDWVWRLKPGLKS